MPVPVPHDYGYVHADRASWPEGWDYTPRRSVNSSGGENEAVRVGTGEYWVFMEGLGTALDSNRGVAHVTAHGASNAYCTIRYTSRSWAGDGTGEPTAWTGVWLSLRCYKPDGAPTDAEFTASWANAEVADGRSGFAYLTTSQLNSHVPYEGYWYNSSGYGVKVSRVATGRYEVQLPGQGGGFDPGAQLGHVQVTAAHAAVDGRRCMVGSIRSAFDPVVVEVNCHAPDSGSPADSLFALTYVRKASLVRTDLAAYTRAQGRDDEHTDPQWTWDALGEPTSVTTGTGSDEGRYWVKTPMMERFDKGNVQVTALGSDARFCKVAKWSPDTGIEVRCFDHKGNPAQTPFLASYAE
ncbi:hypothetical protein [Streptomyces sp. TRM64462]|uniref:hypothetical protein n=1 Tax=Streptomyces sp. TRM64462 TaxID=2741726 RepID=UPI0015865961|nr:hypothetical protein [Streptomyces sp. TRM64462]